MGAPLTRTFHPKIRFRRMWGSPTYARGLQRVFDWFQLNHTRIINIYLIWKQVTHWNSILKSKVRRTAPLSKVFVYFYTKNVSNHRIHYVEQCGRHATDQKSHSKSNKSEFRVKIKEMGQRFYYVFLQSCRLIHFTSHVLWKSLGREDKFSL